MSQAFRLRWHASQLLTSAAQYVSTMPTPARRMLVNVSDATVCRSTQPFAAAALIIAYSPET